VNVHPTLFPVMALGYRGGVGASPPVRGRRRGYPGHRRGNQTRPGLFPPVTVDEESGGCIGNRRAGWPGNQYPNSLDSSIEVARRGTGSRPTILNDHGTKNGTAPGRAGCQVKHTVDCNEQPKRQSGIRCPAGPIQLLIQM